MNNKRKNSHYIITRLFATDYFSYYSKPVIFAAYFLPFIAFGKTRPYLDSEMDEKIRNLKENRHGNFYNYASQGFGNQPFYEPDVNVEYFYHRLCSYESDKLAFFNEREGVVSELESVVMREELREILSDRELLLKRNYRIPDPVKKELLADLETEQVKAVLAKLFYYIVGGEHKIPKTDTDAYLSVSHKLNLSNCPDTGPNITLRFRDNMDEEIEKLLARMDMAKEVQILCLDGISFFGCAASSGDSTVREPLYDTLVRNEDIRLEIILSKPGCRANVDACNYQVNIPHLTRPKVELSGESVSVLSHLEKTLPKDRIFLKVTEKAIPYALFIMKFSDESMDYMKLDMYSPFVGDNSERPSMYIFRKLTPDLFLHFDGVFAEMWKNDLYSCFVNPIEEE